MACREPTPLLSPLTSLLSRDLVKEQGRCLAVFKRPPRKVDLYILVWTLVLGLPSGSKKRTLDGLRVAYQEAIGHTLARSSFYDRLNEPLAKLMKALVLALLELIKPQATLLEGHLAHFADVLAIDATILRLHDLLAKTFTATRTNHTKAAAKLHMVLSVLDCSPRKVKLTSERVGDTAPWKKLGEWVCGCLLLFDLGYYEFNLFDRIEANGGFFLSRAKSNFNGKIVSVNRVWRGRAVSVVGKSLSEVLPQLERQVLDVNVEVSFEKRPYKGKTRRKTRTFRLIACRNVESGKYHSYLTNLPAEALAAEDVTKTYAVRWQVELFFNMLRSHMHLGDFPSRNKHIVEILLWSSVLLAIVSGRLLREIRQVVGCSRHIPLLRWGRVFAGRARRILAQIARPDERRCQELFDLLIHEAPDPNRRRSFRAIEEIPVPMAA